MAGILVIDDDAFLRQTFVDALTGAGHEVRVAADGSQGLALLEERRPDLVVADMVLSGMDGPELVREIRRRDPTLPIVAVSGLAPQRIWSNQDKDGPPPGLVFASKPVDWERFLRAVGALASLESG